MKHLTMPKSYPFFFKHDLQREWMLRTYTASLSELSLYFCSIDRQLGHTELTMHLPG